MSRRVFLCLAGCLLALLGPASWSRATTLLPIDAAALADQADLVFTGTAVHSEVVLSKDGTFPFTFVTFRIEETLKGSTHGRDLTLRFLGGSVGREVVVAEGMPTFKVGESYLLFVTADPRAASPVVGWTRGQFRFDREPRSGQKILVDDRGLPLRGIERGKWLRGLSSSEQSPSIELIGQEGVTISSEPPAEKGLRSATAASEVAGAEQVLGSLRSLLRSRAAQKSFNPGRIVESARTEDVPVRFEGRPISVR